MKMRSRLTALVLAVLMLISTAAPALAADALPLSVYQSMVDSAADQATSQPVIDEGGQVYDLGDTAQPVASGYDTTVEVTLAAGEGEQDVALPVNGKLLLTADMAVGQWQVQVGDQWVNMHGETDSTIEVTFAKVQSLFVMNNAAKLRFISADGSAVSNVANVGLDYSVQTLEEDVAMPMMYKARALNANAGIALAEEVPETGSTQDVLVIIQYMIGTGEEAVEAATPYIANLGKDGGDLTTSVLQLPVVEGYQPGYVTPQAGATFKAPSSENSNGTIQLSLTNVTTTTTFVITYVPAEVEFKVNHMLMGFDGVLKNAVLDKTTTHKGFTNDPITANGSLALDSEYPGFEHLWYDETTKIAADGETVVNIYYERKWYLMLFELDGGYGVEPIYAQYGAPVAVEDPEKTGFTFMGWSPAVPDTVPEGGGTYTAQWGNPQTVPYTVVYWRENANDNGYSFWKSETKYATAGTYVDGGDTLASNSTVITVNGKSVVEKNYVTYNDELTNKHVFINGDGSSVVNVYYTRNVYSITFYYNGECLLEEHVHTDTCSSSLTCEIEAHDHKAAGCSTKCGKDEHVHSSNCCSKTEHASHTVECFGNNVGNSTSKPNNAPNNPKQGEVYRWRPNWYSSYTYYIYIGNSWYIYNSTSVSSGSIAPTTCSGLHTHGDGNCSCSEEEHVHSDNCYTCGKTEHTHTLAACYQLSCGKIQHTHSNANCQYSGSSDDESGSDGYKIYKVITAKYDQDISDEWPTASDIEGFAYWTGRSVEAQSSKIVTMTYNICINGGDKMLAYYDSTKYTLNYMFESFDQTSAANGTTRKYYNGTYYDRSETYSQDAYYGYANGWRYKNITGMTPAQNGNASIDSNNTAWLYYKRLRYTFTFQSYNETLFTTGKNVMFEQPLAEYAYNGTTLSTYEPPEDYYPATLPEDMYVFDGWYTTPECFDGTEFDFTTATMPNSDVTLYAKWSPILLTVEIYDDMNLDEDGNPVYGNKIGETIEVPYGSKVATESVPATPTNGDYAFVGWFYLDTVTSEDGTTTTVEKAFDFANIPVMQNMQIYAKWSATKAISFTIYYKLIDENGEETNIDVAEPLESQALEGTSITVDAKIGNELYAGYRTGYFPKPPSHTVEITVNSERTYTFWYTAAEEVPYRVVHLKVNQFPDGEGKNFTVLDTLKDETIEDNRASLVTAQYERFSGLRPDGYQKRLIVTYPGQTTDNGNNWSDPELGENIIFFYYIEDTEHALWTVSHFVEPVGGAEKLENWQQYGDTVSQTGTIGNTQKTTQLTIEGFTYHVAYVDTYTVGAPAETKDVTNTLQHVLTNGGIDFRLYYTRNEYPVKVQYVDRATGAEMPGTEGGELYTDANGVSAFDYQSQVQVTTDKSFHGYELAGSETQKITINVDSTALNEIEKNIVTFYYKKAEVEINYVGVAPDGTLIDTDDEKQKIGSVTPEAEPGTDGVVTALGGPVAGSTATVASTMYKFAGWYLDATCEHPVPRVWVDSNNKITPRQQDTDNDATTAPLYVSATYYAKFEYNLTSLTIVKDGVNTTKDRGVSFVFIVMGEDANLDVAIKENGRVTIYGLTVGNTYTVTEKLGNWRYSPADRDQSITLVADADENVVTFENTRNSDKWLDGDCYDENEFTAVSQ